ncbi:MAG: hypothetical protein Q4G59_06715, partial [Planctomycetia bacterium]|nr:hypothetical protein [Planctomycetia bacterium]
PRGLFETAVRNVIKNKFPEQFQRDCPEDFQLEEYARSKYNSTYLIGKFLEWSGDNPQWFYNCARNPSCKRFRKLFLFLDGTPLGPGNDNIRILKKNLDKMPLGCYSAAGKDLKPEDNEDRKARQRDLQQYDDLEKNVRQTRMKDVVLLEIARRLLPDMPQAKLRLSQVKPNKFMLKEMEQMEINIDIPASSDPKVSDSLASFTLVGDMKIKNYGNLQRMTSDVRLYSFLRNWKEYRQSNTVTYEEIEKEFDAYDRKREIIFQKLFELEKAVLTKFPDISRDKDGGFVPFKNILECLALSAEKKVLLNIIRNAFAHHRYPEFELLEDPDNAFTVQYLREMKIMAREINKIKTLLASTDTMTEAIVNYAVGLFDSVLKR